MIMWRCPMGRLAGLVQVEWLISKQRRIRNMDEITTGSLADEVDQNALRCDLRKVEPRDPREVELARCWLQIEGTPGLLGREQDRNGHVPAPVCRYHGEVCRTGPRGVRQADCVGRLNQALHFVV